MENKIQVSENVINHLTKICNFSREDVISMITYFEDFHTLNDDEIISVFDENHENHEKYSDMIELVFKCDANEMFCWINDGKYDALELADFTIPENCAGKTLAEAFVQVSDNILELSNGTCVFQYV